MDKYRNALNRDDLTQWLVHFTKGQNNIPFDNLRNILKIGKIFASKSNYITCYYPLGATCFYEVPPQNWIELINTNPNTRRGYGLIVSKRFFWNLGGRPAIYTDNPDLNWPYNERYRLVRTDLSKPQQPIDWTHEREWRFPGDFPFSVDFGVGPWWWPCVEKIKEAQLIFREYSGIHSIYIMELSKVIERNMFIL